MEIQGGDGCDDAGAGDDDAAGTVAILFGAFGGWFLRPMRSNGVSSQRLIWSLVRGEREFWSDFRPVF
jgi:hypothetical protein